MHLDGELPYLKEKGQPVSMVLRLWKVPTFLNPSENGSIKMVLFDDKGGKIHATVKNTLHPYKIVFQLKTKVKLSECSSITPYGLTVTNISDVCAHTHDYEFLVDVIGYMTELSAEREYIRDGKITKMVVVELTDHSGKCDIALFGDYADDLTKKMDKLSGGLPVVVVVVVQFAKVKIFRDKASLQNVMNTTRFFVNPDIAEVESFRNSVAVHGVELDSSVPLIGQPPKPSFEDDACDRHVFQVVPRFRVKVEVTDRSALAVFVIIDSEMSFVMEKSCAYFVSQAKVCSGCSHPNEFDDLVGKRMLFSVQRSPQLRLAISSYRVKRICMDPVVIEQLCSQVSYSTSPKIMQPAIDLESDGGADEADAVLDSQSIEFLEDVIVTPTNVVEK
ncbi:replication factor A protein [Trifolium repens]|nr:replication factor A protein [Trifolium repens]